MPSKHTRERLVVVSGAIETESGTPIAHMDRCHGNGTTPVERDDTAARMVLAYNSLNEKEVVMGQMQTIGRGHTKVTTEYGVTRVRYVDTDVVVFDVETITLNTGGWRTVTTKARMNQTANQYDLGFYVYQKDFEWFVKIGSMTTPFHGSTLILRRAEMRSMSITPESLKQSGRET